MKKALLQLIVVAILSAGSAFGGEEAREIPATPIAPAPPAVDDSDMPAKPTDMPGQIPDSPVNPTDLPSAMPGYPNKVLPVQRVASGAISGGLASDTGLVNSATQALPLPPSAATPSEKIPARTDPPWGDTKMRAKPTDILFEKPDEVKPVEFPETLEMIPVPASAPVQASTTMPATPTAIPPVPATGSEGFLPGGGDSAGD